MEECKNQKINIVQGDPLAALYAQSTYEAGALENDMSFSKTLSPEDELSLRLKAQISLSEDSILEPEEEVETNFKVCCGEDFVISLFSDSVIATYQGYIGPGV